MAKKNRLWIWIGVVVVVVIVGALLMSGAQSFDGTGYDYTDSSLEHPDAEHTIVEYSDFQCPFCGDVAPVMSQVKKDFSVHVEFKHFPLTSIHPFAQVTAEAAECARDQDRFWAFHDAVFDNQQRISRSFLEAVAEGLGLDMDAFTECLDSRVKQTVVAQDKLEGQQAGVTGTPTIWIDGERFNGRTYADFAAALQ